MRVNALGSEKKLDEALKTYRSTIVASDENATRLVFKQKGGFQRK